MASPVIEARAESAQTADTTTHTVSRPAGVSGRLTIIAFGCDGNNSAVVVTWPSGYTEWFSQNQATSHFVRLAYHLDDGTEGTSITVTTDVGEKSAHLAWQFSGAENPSTQAPEATGVSAAASANPDPPSITPTGGSKDYTFIAAFIQTGEEVDDDTWCNSAPTNYGNLVQKTSGITGGSGTNISHAAADRALTASTEDPGTFNTDQSLNYLSYTIAVHPAAAAGAPTLPWVEMADVPAEVSQWF